MRKPLKIKLTIPKPCNEDWDKMTPDEKGRHCSMCNTIIADFSTFTDKELVAYLSKAKGEICGRVDNTQLDRLLITNEASNTPAYRSFLFGAALTAGLVSNAHSQVTVSQNKVYHPHPVGYIADTNVPKLNNTIAADTSTVLKGRIIDSQKMQPITDALLEIQFDSSYNAEAYSDSTGKFSIALPNKYLNKKMSVIVTAYHYTESVLTFNFNKSSKGMTIKLRKSKVDRTLIMGKMEMHK